MAKIRVHELAKEVGRSNREIIDFLTEKGYDAKTAVSVVPDAEVDVIRTKYGFEPKHKEAEEPVKPRETARRPVDLSANKEEEKPKKKGIIRVFHSQNATGSLQRKPARGAVSGPKGGNPRDGKGGPVGGPRSLKSRADKLKNVVGRTMGMKLDDITPDVVKPRTEASSGTEEIVTPSSEPAQVKAETKPAEKAPVRTAEPPVKEEVKTEPVKVTEPVKAAEPFVKEPEKKAEVTDKKETQKVSANELKPEKKETTEAKQETVSAPKAEEVKKPAPKAETAPAVEKAEKETSPQAAGTEEASSGFRNGKVIRSYGRDFANYGKKPAQNKENKDAKSGGQGRNAQGGRNQNSQRGPRGDRNTGERGGNERGANQGSRNFSGRDGGASQGGGRSFGQRGDRSLSPANRSYGNRQDGTSQGGGRSFGSRDGAGQGRSTFASRNDRNDRRGDDRGRQNSGFDKDAQSQNTRGGFDKRGQSQGGGRSFQGGQGSFGGFKGRQAAPAADGDGSLAHKTSRNFHGDEKKRERTREERRENGRHGSTLDQGNITNRPNQKKKQFNRVPKALQDNKPKAGNEPEVKDVIKELKIPEKITVRELAEKMKLVPAQLVKELFMKGNMVTVNHELTYDQAEEIALEHDIVCEPEEKEDVIGELLKEEEESEDEMTSRPPVVCVMGHVDHGKTSLLDAIRDTNVTDREAGGITQAIGAYMVSVNGQKITFLDTPGHEAFTAMRMRGANSTDIAVLVVAADDGVMPQTIEAINHAKAAGVEIIVAVNKIDKPGANVDRVKQELTEYGLIAEDWGGSTVFCEVSAKKRIGIDNLLDMILLTAEVMELKANPNRNARGIVLEAKLDKGRGPVASILIQKGTLHQGDFIACGAASGKVRAMTDENGKRLHKATPSMPVEIIGLSSVPEAGEVLVQMDTEKEARDFASVFVAENRKTLLEATKTQMSLDDLFEQIKEGNLKELPIVVKADVQGSVEAVSQSLLKLSNEEVVVKVIHGGVGAINESDVNLASASNAIIIGFNVRPDTTAKAIADQQNVEIHLYDVIYEAIEDVTRALNGMRAAVYEEKILGHVEIRQIFKASGIGNIAGSYVKDGIIQKSSKVRVFRGKDIVFEGELASLKRFKDDVKEVREGFECGLVFKDWGDFELEDRVEAYTMVEVPRE